MHDTIEIEQKVLALIIAEPSLYYEYNDRLYIDLFSDIQHKLVFEKTTEIYKDGDVPDIIKLSKKLQWTGKEMSDLVDIVDIGFNYIDVDFAISTLKEAADLRRLNSLTLNMHSRIQENLSTEKITSFLEDELNKIRQDHKDTTPTFKALLSDTLEDITNRMQSDGTTGITSGFASIDRFTGGWQETDLIILGGASSMGKTSFALALAHNSAKAGVSTLIFSYEMSGKQLLSRLISSETDINNKYIQQGALSKENYNQINTAIGKLEKLPLNIDECKKTSLTYLINKIKKYVMTHDVKIVFIDYLQLISSYSKAGTREQEVSKVVRSLKNTARQLDITIVALSQLNRGVMNRTDARPTMSDLRESGEIEQAADVVAFVYRAEYYGITQDEKGEDTRGTADIIFAKGRNIGIGTVRLRFKSNLTKFTEYEQDF